MQTFQVLRRQTETTLKAGAEAELLSAVALLDTSEFADPCETTFGN